MNKIRSIILLTFMSVMCMSVRAAAVDDSNVIYSKAINAHPTDAIEIPVYLNNKNYGVKSLQFTIVLPDGMSFVSNGTNYKFTKTDALNDDWTVTARTKKGEDSHSAIVMMYNTNDDTAVLPVADKEILSLSVKVDDNMTLGDYNVTIKSVTLTSADNTEYTYSSYTNKSSLTVSQLLVSSISLNKSSLTIDALQKDTLTATILPEKAKDKTITWTSSNEKVAKVSKEGVVEAIVGGTATITATANDGSGVAASCLVTVVNPEFKLTYKVDGEVYKEFSVAYTTALKAIDAPTKDGYTFSGWSDIPATMPAKDVVVTGTFTLSNIRISPSSLVLSGGERSKLKVYLGSKDTTEISNVQWSIEDGTIASIRPNGVIRGLKSGTTKVTAIMTQSATVKATCDVTVSSDYTMTELPDVDFEFNFNAHNYDEANKRIPNNNKANLRDCYLQLQGNEPTLEQDERLSISNICKGYINKWNMDSSESGQYFRRTGTDSMTIICKVAPKLDTNTSCDFIGNTNSEYNYMLRIGNQNAMYLHTGIGYNRERALSLESEEEQILAIRVNGAENTLRLDNLSTGESMALAGVNYGEESNTLMKFFYNSDTEYFTGDFFWCYMSFEYLTDSELNSVMDYNEDITYKAAMKYVTGDANTSGSVNVTDITSVVGHIFGNTPSPFSYEAADVNNNGTINVADVAGIVNIIYGTGTASSASRVALGRIQSSTADHISIDSLSAAPGDEVELQVGIASSQTEFSSYEMDLIMPEGIEVVESGLSLERTDERNFQGAYVGGNYKLLSYSMTNEPFKGTSGTVGIARLKMDENMPAGVYEIKVRNIILSNQGEEITLPDYTSTITIGEKSGIGEILVQDKDIEMYDLTGRRVESAEGLNGMYIISTKGKNGQQMSHKVLIR